MFVAMKILDLILRVFSNLKSWDCCVVAFVAMKILNLTLKGFSNLKSWDSVIVALKSLT